MNNTRTRILIPLVLIVLIVSGFFAYQRFSAPTSPTTPTDETDTLAGETAPPASPVPNDEELQVSYTYLATESGQLALDLIQANAEVETQDYGEAGQFITSVNGLAGNNEHYWAFYVNNEYAEQGASQTVLQEGDVIRLTYENVQQVIRIPIEGESIPNDATPAAEVPNVEAE